MRWPRCSVRRTGGGVGPRSAAPPSWGSRADAGPSPSPAPPAARTFPDAGAEARERRRRRLLTEEEEAAADAAELQRLYREQAEEDELKGHTRVGRRARLTMRSTTKHDPAEAALRNARRLGRFEGAGDMWTGHTRVPQAASNSLKRHFQSRQRKGCELRPAQPLLHARTRPYVPLTTPLSRSGCRRGEVLRRRLAPRGTRCWTRARWTFWRGGSTRG